MSTTFKDFEEAIKEAYNVMKKIKRTYVKFYFADQEYTLEEHGNSAHVHIIERPEGFPVRTYLFTWTA